MDNDLLLLGWREWLALPGLGLPRIKAKIDTGARSSSLHVGQLEVVQGDTGLQARFVVQPGPDTAPVAFSLALVAKDLDLITALANQVGARSELASTVRATVGEAVADGHGDADMSALATYLRRPRSAPPG